MEKYIVTAAISVLLIFSNYTVVVGLDAARGELQDARQTIEYIKPISTEVSNDIFMINENVTNLWIMRQIGPMLADTGFIAASRKGHGYVAEGDATYFLTVIDRGADIMAERGLIGMATCDALKTEARDRVTRGAFFGFMSYVSLIATKPGENV